MKSCLGNDRHSSLFLCRICKLSIEFQISCCLTTENTELTLTLTRKFVFKDFALTSSHL